MEYGTENADKGFIVTRKNIGKILNMWPRKFLALNLPWDYASISEFFTVMSKKAGPGL